MSQHIPVRTQESASPSSDGGARCIADDAAEYRANRKRATGMLRKEVVNMQTFAARTLQEVYSRFKYIRPPLEDLKFLAEAKVHMSSLELGEANGQRDSRAAYIWESVLNLGHQKKALKICAQSRGLVECGLLGCPACSSNIRAEACGEAAAYLKEIAASPTPARFFSITIATNAWQKPLFDADEFVNKEMVRTLRKLTQELHFCSDLLLSIEGSLVPADRRLESSKPTPANVEAILSTPVSWHFHGVGVCRDKNYWNPDLVKKYIDHVLHFQLPIDATHRVLVEPLRISPSMTGGNVADDAVKWLSYITKQLTADTLTPLERLLFRSCLNRAYSFGVLSTGPILYHCNEVTRLKNFEDYAARKLEEGTAFIEAATSEELQSLVRLKEAQWADAAQKAE